MRDAVSAAVIRESFSSIVREMRRAFAASAYSSIIYEGYDFSCVLIDREGQLVAQSGEDHPFHIIPVAWSVSTLLEKGVKIDPELIYLHNDPYTGGTHLNDVAVVYPVAIEGVSVFFIVLRAHWADIGGMTPGSLSGAASEILQEGLRLNHVPVPKSGISPVMDLIFDNVRVTREAKADFQAAIGTCRVAERQLRGVIAKYGLETVELATAELLNSAERRMRVAISRIPEGEYRFTSYMDGHVSSSFPLHVDVLLTVTGETVKADYSGTADQIPAPLNAGPAIAPTSVLTVLKSFLDPSGSINSGTLRPIETHVPIGSILHAVHPAPCGGLNEVRFASDAAVMGALGQAVPERMTGDVRGSTNHTYIGGIDFSKEQDFIFYEYPSGGTGAFSTSDGNTAVRAFNEGENVSIQSSEIVGRIFPLKVERNEMRADSGGPGRFRGGVGLVREIRVLTDEARFSLLSDRNLVPPFGVNGGRSGRPNQFTVLRNNRAVRTSDFPGKVSDFVLKKGDVVRMESSGGGGYGRAEQRTDGALMRDLVDGVITEKGLKDYGAEIWEGGLKRGAVRDEAVVKLIQFERLRLNRAHCAIGKTLAEQLAIKNGQMLELVPSAGPPLRFWVTEIAKDEQVSLVLAERWKDRLPPGPYSIRATPDGTVDYLDAQVDKS